MANSFDVKFNSVPIFVVGIVVISVAIGIGLAYLPMYGKAIIALFGMLCIFKLIQSLTVK